MPLLTAPTISFTNDIDFFTNDINEYPLTSTFIIGLLLQYKNILQSCFPTPVEKYPSAQINLLISAS